MPREIIEPAHRLPIEPLEQEGGDSAAALAEARGEREASEPRAGSGLRKRVARDPNRFELEMSATDRSVRDLRSYDHLRSGFARRRTAGRRDRDQNRAAFDGERGEQWCDPLAHRRTSAAWPKPERAPTTSPRAREASSST